MKAMEILMKAPAKINLTLDVLHKRDDGFHEVEMVMSSIDLADRIYVKVLNQPIIQIGTSVSYLPLDDRNLAYQAAALLRKRFNIRQGVHIYIEKNIPVAAGLAGGSSNAAATIKALNHLWQLHLTKAEMAELGAELGSDIPFCIYGGTALAKGRGEKITPLLNAPVYWVVLAKPPLGISTGDIYHKLDLNECDYPYSPSMIKAIENRNIQEMINSMGNALETVTLKENERVRHLKQHMMRFGAQRALMSGSGPSIFTITENFSKARRIYNGLRGFCKQVYVIRSLSNPNNE